MSTHFRFWPNPCGDDLAVSSRASKSFDLKRAATINRAKQDSFGIARVFFRQPVVGTVTSDRTLCDQRGRVPVPVPAPPAVPCVYRLEKSYPVFIVIPAAFRNCGTFTFGTLILLRMPISSFRRFCDQFLEIWCYIRTRFRGNLLRVSWCTHVFFRGKLLRICVCGKKKFQSYK